MRLTANVFAELVRSLRSNPRGVEEKRVMPRVGLRGRAEISPRDRETGLGRPPVPVGVRDVSASGIGLTCGQPFEPGDAFVLLLDGDGATNAADTTCTVVHCRRVGDGLYRLGARFDDYRP